MLEAVTNEFATVLTETPVQRWRTIPIDDSMTSAAKRIAIRLNALGSLFYFNKVILGHSRMSPNLHGYMCRELEQDSLRLAMEIPRDMFKTSVASVSAPMWWALPFNDTDEEYMRSMGYGDAWIRWMHRAHYSSTRTLIASEIIDNAIKIGTRISGHYQSNDLFRFIFPEIVPKSSLELSGTGKKKDKWNARSMTHNRVDGVIHGEGTFDFIGAKGALQSRHYDRQVIDDIVGEKAIKSDLVMEDTIGWIRKLPGAFDTDPLNPGRLADQLFIGNRWSQRDVGAWLRREQPDIKFVTHSALGGCCDIKNPDGSLFHPRGESIFPEEFPVSKLNELKQIWGSYNFACQYENNPIDAGAVRFKSGWLRRYSRVVWDGGPHVTIANSQQIPPNVVQVSRQIEQERAEAAGAMPERLKMAMRHETQSGEVIEDIRAGDLDRVAILDPTHSEKQSGGRSRNAIVVLGYLNRPPASRRIYLLDCWAGGNSFEEMIEKLVGVRPGSRGLAVRWKVHHIYLESEVAGQQGWKYYFQERVRQMGPEASFSIRPLKTDRGANAKHTRIVGMEPIYENGLFWVPRTGCEQFMEEYEQYPNDRFMDILDVIGYAPQTWLPGSRTSTRDFVRDELRRRSSLIQSIGQAGY
jgi:hypothetical protein